LELDACAAPDPEAFAALEEAQRRRARRRDELRLSCAESQGRVKNHREAMSECARELNDPELRGVDVALSKQVLELKTFEMTASDLDRYHGALDRALMAFHASKMSDINKVVRELWQRTYRGQDIDYIQIRSDAGSASGRPAGAATTTACAWWSGTPSWRCAGGAAPGRRCWRA
jgi:DNA repair protein RAD50